MSLVGPCFQPRQGSILIFMDTEHTDGDDLRTFARKRIKAKREFWNLVFIFVIITVIVNTVWLYTGPNDYYWPMWPMLGFGIATLFTALGAYGPGGRPISEEQIDREIRRLRGE